MCCLSKLCIRYKRYQCGEQPAIFAPARDLFCNSLKQRKRKCWKLLFLGCANGMSGAHRSWLNSRTWEIQVVDNCGTCQGLPLKAYLFDLFICILGVAEKCNNWHNGKRYPRRCTKGRSCASFRDEHKVEHVTRARLYSPCKALLPIHAVDKGFLKIHGIWVCRRSHN